MSGKIFYVESAVDIDGVATLVRYTDRIEEAAGFVLMCDGSFCEACVLDEEFLADPDDMPEPSGRVWYECNGEREGCRRTICYKNPGNRWAPGTVCRKTSDIRAARNFYESEGDWWEKV